MGADEKVMGTGALPVLFPVSARTIVIIVVLTVLVSAVTVGTDVFSQRRAPVATATSH